MHPALSVIFLTTLIGAGQGLFLALYAAELAHRAGWADAAPGSVFFISGAALAVVLTGAGAIASMFHLGRPERAWRAMAMWRTSWLSREGIALLAFGATVLLYGVLHATGRPGTVAVGALALAVNLGLFVCTGMIYACLRFLQEWASPLTVLNFIVLGCASGLTLSAALAGFTAADLVAPLTTAAIATTLLGLATRAASLARNARLRPASTLQSATGIHHPKIVQTSRGFTGGAFNLREFFHGRSAATVTRLTWSFIVLVFVLPPLLLLAGRLSTSLVLPCLAFIVQYVGLLAERWVFFAQARHPQNLYYQARS